MLCLGRSCGQNARGLRPIGFWPWDLPRHSIHHDTSSAFSNNVPLYPDVSSVTCQVSDIGCHMSGVTCQLSCVMRHVTCVICNIFSFTKWLRLCYQQGLPPLVFDYFLIKNALISNIYLSQLVVVRFGTIKKAN